MKKYIPYLLSALLIIGFSFLTTEKSFSQMDTSSQATSGGNSTYVKGITPGRARALVGVACGLISLIIGWRAKVRSKAGIGNKGRNGAIVALSLGAIALVLSIIHLSVSAGAVFGSGSGKAGAIFGLLLGLVGTTLGGLALRSHKID
jgi:hypothetical protein